MAANYLEEGKKFMEKGEINPALESFTKHIEQNPNDALGYMYLGHCYKALRENENAIVNYQKAIGLDSDNIEVAYNCGEAYISLSQYDQAITMLEKVTSLAEKDEKYRRISEMAKDGINYAKNGRYNKEGTTYLEQEKWQDAIICFQKAIDSYPNAPRSYSNMAVAYLNSGNEDAGMEWFRKSIECDPKYTRGYYNLGTLYLKRGWYKNAVEVFEKALEINPQSRDAEDIRQNLTAGHEELEDNRKELLKITEGKSMKISTDKLANLITGVIGEKIDSVDVAILENGKNKIYAYSSKKKYAIEAGKTEIIIKEE